VQFGTEKMSELPSGKNDLHMKIFNMKTS